MSGVDQSNADAIIRRLNEAHESLRSIYTLSGEAVGLSNDELRAYMTIAINHMAKASMKGIDACIERLGGQANGNFEDEFSLH